MWQAEEVHGLEAAENHYQKMQSFVRGDRSASSSPKPPSPQTTKSGTSFFLPPTCDPRVVQDGMQGMVGLD